jgi:16S rRNA (guanine1516-N2)-methyltransferase
VDFPVFKDRLILKSANSIDSFSLFKKIDVIYLDPMFPERKKSASVKQEMQMMQELVGADSDADDLFEHALKSSVKRIVVKRPKLAPPLMHQKPSHQIVSKKCRFDVYLQHTINTENRRE